MIVPSVSLLGRISDADAEPLEMHVAACPRCTVKLRQLRASDPLVDAPRQTPPPCEQGNTPFVHALIPSLKRLLPDDPELTLEAESCPSAPPSTVAYYNFLAPAGTYRVHLKTPRERRVFVPDAFVVKAGEAQTIELRLVGQLAKVGGFAFPITGVAAPLKGDRIILASSLDGASALGVWDGKSDSFKFPNGATQQMTCVALAPDGVYAATGPGMQPKRDETSIHLWGVRLDLPKLLEKLPGHAVFVKALAFSPNGTR